MDEKKLRIVFFGTPEIAAIELEHLVKCGYNVVGVVTNIDKPQGRGKKLTASEVKLKALELNLKILQPVSMKDENFLNELKALQPDVQIVVAFRMMPKSVYSLAPLGTFNLHTSLLPQYRGAAPINWAIINGEKITGISTFLLNDKIDCGEILLQQKIDITYDMNFEMLYNIMAEKGKKLIEDTLHLISKGNYTTIKQDTNIITKPAPKIFKEDTYINFAENAEKVRNFIRGLAPSPAAKAKFFEVRIYANKIQNDIGDLWIEGKQFLLVQCADAILQVTDLQLNGKKRMPAKELIKGLRINGILKKN